MSQSIATSVAPVSFSFENFTVRAINRDGNIWFVAADVCAVLDIKNVSDTLIKVLDDDEKGIDIIYTLGGPQKMAIINESGLYALILRSRKPEAKRFRKWVTSEVLPAIRRTGAYIHALAVRPAITPEQQRELKADIRQISANWLCLKDQWIYNHVRVAFHVDRFEHIPQDLFPVAKQLIDSKKEATSQFLCFIRDLKDWFEREVLGAGTPWTPAIQKKLTCQMKRQVILPPKVDWLALADEVKHIN